MKATFITKDGLKSTEEINANYPRYLVRALRMNEAFIFGTADPDAPFKHRRYCLTDWNADEGWAIYEEE